MLFADEGGVNSPLPLKFAYKKLELQWNEASNFEELERELRYPLSVIVC